MSDEENNIEEQISSDTEDNSATEDNLASHQEELEEFSPPPSTEEPTKSSTLTSLRELEAVYDVPVQISAVLGKATLPVNQLLKLGRGAVVELDRRVGEAIDIYVNNRLVARGEVVMVEDRLGVTMTEIIKSDR